MISRFMHKLGVKKRYIIVWRSGINVLGVLTYFTIESFMNTPISDQKKSTPREIISP